MSSLTPEDLRIVVCCHKQCALPSDSFLLPLHVGAALHDYELPFDRDDQILGKPCQNISAKNESYCELTALYWMWKNLPAVLPDLHYVGLCHYRRYFAFGDQNRLRTQRAFDESSIVAYAVDSEALAGLLHSHDVVALRPLHYPYSNFVHYAHRHMGDDLRCLMRVTHDLCPEADDAMCRTLMMSNTLSPCNMFVMSWNHCVEYCAWLFMLLEELERRLDISSYDSYQRRIFGFMSERLMNVWFDWRNLKVATVPMATFGPSKGNALPKEVANNLRYDMAFRMGRVSPSRSRSDFERIIASGR